MKTLKAFLLLSLLCAVPGTATAQSYPTKPVRLIVGLAPGGAMDAVSRLIAEKLSAALGQQFVVENRPGAGGTIAVEAVARAEPDGYTLCVCETSMLAGPVIYPKASYDPIKSFTPVAGLAIIPLAIVANPSVPANNIQDLIGLLKANPGKYLYAGPGAGTLQHVAGEMFKRQAGVNMDVVQYKGGNPAITDVIAGQVPLGIVSLSAALTQQKAGKLKVLAVTNERPLPAYPEIGTVAQALPGFDATPTAFVLAPTGTPAPIVAQLSAAIEKALGEKSVTDVLAAQAMTPDYRSPDRLSSALPVEAEKWAGIARQANIKAE